MPIGEVRECSCPIRLAVTCMELACGCIGAALKHRLIGQYRYFVSVLFFLIVEEFDTEAEADVHVARAEVLEDVVVGDVEIEHGGIAAIFTIGDASSEGGAEAIVDHVEIEALRACIFEVLDIRRLHRDNRTDTTIRQIVNQGRELKLGPDTDVL